MRAQLLLDLHRKQVAVEHGRRLHEGFRQRYSRHLDGEAASLQDTPLHIVDAVPEMRVARVEVRPGVDDRDDRLARPVRWIVAHLHDAGSMPEAAQIVGAEPSCRAQIFRLPGPGESGWHGELLKQLD
jgi:hypothetical protein